VLVRDSALTAFRSWRPYAGAVYALTKPRLAAMSVLTTLVAYATARPTPGNFPATVAGTVLAAAGALALNQWWEREADARMVRTRGRPLPQAQLTPRSALAWSVAFSLGGVGVLAAGVNVTAAAFAAATIVIYGLIYTPLKRRTRWATEVGALSGALPALLGNAAAGDPLARPGLILGGILLLWQMPHFFAIGWRHRRDYHAAGFPLRPAVDATGRNTASWSFGYTLLLAPVSLVPWVAGWCGAAYGVAAAFAGGWLLQQAGRFRWSTDRDASARSLFLATLLYLPCVMGALLLDQLLGR
jgi:protoheme IX farnesyltransferase